MTTRMKIVIAAIGLTIASAAASLLRAEAQAPATTETPSSFVGTPLTRVGVVVRDVKKAADAYKDIFQLDAVPAVTNVTIELPKGRVKVKRAVVVLPNVTIEVDQPDGNSIAQDRLKKFGQGIYRLGFSTPDPLEPKITALESQGGTIIARSKTGTFAWLDLTSRLNTTIELHQETSRVTGKMPPTPHVVNGKAILGKTPLTHVGFATLNIDEWVKNCRDVFGVMIPPIRVAKAIGNPPNYKTVPELNVRLTSFNTGGPDIEANEPNGQSNWTEFLAPYGNVTTQHLAFPVGEVLQQTIRLFESKGATWNNGRTGGNFSYSDFRDTLGIVIELTGKWID